MNLQLSPDQKYALKSISDWWTNKNKSSYLTLGGYAGTGKTTLISILRNLMHKKRKKLKVAFVSFTGKAAQVLKNKLIENKSLLGNDYVGTIHSLIYSPIVNSKEEIIGWERKQDVDSDLIIIDEASMVDQNIWQDLLLYRIPILAVGDHGQLPPIHGKFNLMEEPQIKLENIHRQAQGNPIIKISKMARTSGQIPKLKFDDKVRKLDKIKPETQEFIEDLMMSYDENTMILCGYNNTRIKINNQIRQMKGFESQEPQSGDRVICLRNNHMAEIYNGMLGTIRKITKESKKWYYAEIVIDTSTINNSEDTEKKNNREKIFKGLIATEQFNNPKTLNFTEQRRDIMDGDLFDFGYALTVHKAQGSQSKQVILFEERFRNMDDEMWKRWLYTAITRAEEELYIVG